MCHHGQCHIMCFISAPWFKYVKPWRKTQIQACSLHWIVFTYPFLILYGLSPVSLTTIEHICLSLSSSFLLVTYSFTAPVDVFSPLGKSKCLYTLPEMSDFYDVGGGDPDHKVSQTEFCWGGGTQEQSSSKPIKVRHMAFLLMHINHWIWVLACMSMCTSVGKWGWTKLFTR